MKNRPDVIGKDILEPTAGYVSPRRAAILASIEADQAWIASDFHKRIYGPCGSTYMGGDCHELEKADDALSDLESRFETYKARLYAAHT